MKKLFLSLMLVASVAAGFTSCKKDTPTSETHSQTFTLGETSYDIDNVVTIENIQYNGSQIYNAIVLSQGEMIGNSGGEGKGIVIVFRGDITAGTHSLTFNHEDPTANFPIYAYAELEVEDVVNFNIYDLMAQDGVYAANSGSFTLEISGDNYTITTSNIEVENVKDASNVKTSSTDYEGGSAKYVLATVQEGDINGVNIVTAGATKFTYIVEQKVLCFITETADLIGYFYQGGSIPTGTINNATLVYASGMNVNNGIQVGQGSITIEKNEDVYTVDIPSVTINGTQYTLHYVGTMPSFDFPF